MSIFEETYRLNNGVEIPKLALGTWLIDNDQAIDAVRAAIRLGYTHVDSAQAYGNEAGVGEGVRTCGVDRDKLFVVSKVAAEHKTYESAAASIDETLKKMGMDYLDMMIIHAPQPWADFRGGRYDEGNIKAWRALEDAYKAGKLRAIGVSNFDEHDVQNILDHCTVKPMVNQVLAHISNIPFALVEFCTKNDILMEAYSPIAHGAALSIPEIADMAKKYNVTPAQLCICYDLQLGFVVLPKTANPEHMADNAKVDFVISDEDMETLNKIPCLETYGDHDFFPVFAKGKNQA